MHRPRRHRRSSARLSFSLLSVLALLAFAGAPALAQAECTESGCAQYEVEIPESGGGNHNKHSNPEGGGAEPKAHASNQPNAGNGGSESTGGEGQGEGKHAGAAASSAGNNGGGNSNGAGGAGKGNEGLGGEQEVSAGSQSGKPASHSSGGSSPLVPILIAIAVLAAISIGAVIYRQRRQDGGGSGSPVSPNAG
jgi:cobalamin biosynthesis Mg chelatase CobN